MVPLENHSIAVTVTVAEVPEFPGWETATVWLAVVIEKPGMVFGGASTLRIRRLNSSEI